jgi:hypothetical protein
LGGCLFGGFAGFEELAALALHLDRAPGMGGTAVETFSDVSVQPFKLRNV